MEPQEPEIYIANIPGDEQHDKIMYNENNTQVGKHWFRVAKLLLTFLSMRQIL